MTGGIAAPVQADVFTNTSLPTIAGKAVEGETLSEGHANWNTPPAAYAYQWQRCNSSGNDCEGIKEARLQSYRVTGKDVGFTIRVAEDARNAAGAVTPSVSEPTAVVQGQATGAPGGGGSGGHGGGAPSPGPAPCCDRPGHVGSAEIKALLVRQLKPAGNAGSISALLAHSGLSMSFRFPEAGALVVKWYLLPTATKRGSRKKARPVLLATGQVTFTAAGKHIVKVRLTVQGRKLLRHATPATKLHLEAQGSFAPKGQRAVRAAVGFVLKR
jgi:hypothetical protein